MLQGKVTTNVAFEELGPLLNSQVRPKRIGKINIQTCTASQTVKNCIRFVCIDRNLDGLRLRSLLWTGHSTYLSIPYLRRPATPRHAGSLTNSNEAERSQQFEHIENFGSRIQSFSALKDILQDQTFKLLRHFEKPYPTMAAHVVVIDSSFRQIKIPVSPASYMTDVLQKACEKFNITPSNYGLK